MLHIILSAPSAPPGNLVITMLESRSVHLSWIPPPAGNINGIIRKYTLRVTEQTTGTVLTEESHNTTLEVYGLHPHTTYSVAVSAFTIREGPYAELHNVRTLEDSKCISELGASYLALKVTTY